MAHVSLPVAFFGGVLSLLSPCSALLLPAFFAYAFQAKLDLIRKTAVFYLGLAATLVPLGMGISAVSRLFYGHRHTLVLVAGALVIFFGVMQICGRGFSVGPLARLQSRIRGRSTLSIFVLGAVYGFGGFCSGPILGAVLTVAAASGKTLDGAGLLAVYAAGMAAPLFLLALLWDRLDLGRRRWLRGKELSLGRFRLHTTALISGIMFIALGVLFIVYDGTGGLPVSGDNLAFFLENALGKHAGEASGLVTAVLALFAVVLLARKSLRQRGNKQEKRAR